MGELLIGLGVVGGVLVLAGAIADKWGARKKTFVSELDAHRRR